MGDTLTSVSHYIRKWWQKVLGYLPENIKCMNCEFAVWMLAWMYFIHTRGTVFGLHQLLLQKMFRFCNPTVGVCLLIIQWSTVWFLPKYSPFSSETNVCEWPFAKWLMALLPDIWVSSLVTNSRWVMENSHREPWNHSAVEWLRWLSLTFVLWSTHALFSYRQHLPCIVKPHIW